VAIAPGFFVADSSGRSRPAAAAVPPDAALLDAARSCPVGAISVVEVATGRVLAPEPAISDTY
jgi:ferredoxin